MRTSISTRFGEWGLLIDSVQSRILIPWVGEEIKSGQSAVKIGNFNQCTRVYREVRVAIVPGTVLVQAGETGKPYVIAVIHPSISLGQLAINSESSHGKNPERHLPDMILCNVVFQIIIVMVIHLCSVFLDASQQIFFSCLIQKVVERIVSQ